MTGYPRVTGEVATLDLVLAGRSLSRYGDGEFKMCLGSDIKSQGHHPALQARLSAILKASGDCLVGIPNLRDVFAYFDPKHQKAKHWGKQVGFYKILADRPYVSSFVTRPDSAPWINTDAYWRAVESLWVGRAVTLVRGSTKSLTAEDLVGAGEVTEIIAPPQHAWTEYERLLERIGRPERALICLGPTATVMAVDLCARGVHAIDLGHIGMFLKKWRRGQPMVVTDADRGVVTV